jgi:hypothetical protein
VTARDILLVVIIPLLLAEVGPWCGWLAAKLLPWAAKLRYGNAERAAIRLEEWSGDLEDIPGQLTKLAYAIGQLTAGSVVFARQKTKHGLWKIKTDGLNNPIDLTDHEFPYMPPERWKQFWEIVEEEAARRGLPAEPLPGYPTDWMAPRLARLKAKGAPY